MKKKRVLLSLTLNVVKFETERKTLNGYLPYAYLLYRKGKRNEKRKHEGESYVFFYAKRGKCGHRNVGGDRSRKFFALMRKTKKRLTF